MSQRKSHSNITQITETYENARRKFYSRSFAEAQNMAFGLVEDAVRLARVEHKHPNPQPTFSLIILSHQTTPKFLDSMDVLAELAPELTDAELIFVSNDHHDLRDLLSLKFQSYTLVEPGFNFGCSGGRNVGAHFAKAKHIVFLDDDGTTDIASIKALLKPLQDNPETIAVRGRAIPSPGQISPKHYCPAAVSCPSHINLEGLSAWRKTAFLEAGGFDILLAGYEGLDLTVRLLPINGYGAFQYIPDAILHHDYAVDQTKLDFKKSQIKIGEEYLDFNIPHWRMSVSAFRHMMKAWEDPIRKHQRPSLLADAQAELRRALIQSIYGPTTFPHTFGKKPSRSLLRKPKTWLKQQVRKVSTNMWMAVLLSALISDMALKRTEKKFLRNDGKKCKRSPCSSLKRQMPTIWPRRLIPHPPAYAVSSIICLPLKSISTCVAMTKPRHFCMLPARPGNSFPCA